MRETIYRCNQCTTEKKLTNHWWVARICRHLQEGEDYRNFTLAPWKQDWIDPDAKPEDDEEVLHLCGQKCAGEVVAKWMDGVTGDGQPSEIAG